MAAIRYLGSHTPTAYSNPNTFGGLFTIYTTVMVSGMFFFAICDDAMIMTKRSDCISTIALMLINKDFLPFVTFDWKHGSTLDKANSQLLVSHCVCAKSRCQQLSRWVYSGEVTNYIYTVLLQEAQLSLRDRETCCQLKSGKILHKCSTDCT